MARKAVIPDTDTEEVAGLLNEHALGTGTRSASRPGSTRRGGLASLPKAGSSNKTRNVAAQGCRGPNGNLANNAVKRAPEHSRQLRSATRSVEPQAAPERKRKADIFEVEDDIEEEGEEGDGEEGHEDSSSRRAEQKKQTARPSKKMKSHIAIQDSEVEFQDSEGEGTDTVEEETVELEATNRIGLAAPLVLDAEALHTKMLLGNEHLWKMIQKASRRNRRRAQECTELESDIMTDLVEKLTEVRQIYHSLAADDLAAGEVDETEAELDTGLNDICTTVDDLSKSSAGRQASKVVYEAYMNGVIQFVSLLKQAMKGRVLKSSPKAYDLDGLEEIIFIQDTFLRFLEKLNTWKVSSEGFTRNVQQRIKPYLRAMLNNFQKHLAGERIAEKRRLNREITASQQAGEIVSPQVQQQKKAAYLEVIRRRILRSAQEESLRWGGNLRLLDENRAPVLHQAPSVRAARTRPNEWTVEEDTALIHELLNNKETRGLPVDERYRMILNNDLLSNKLPEHIEERAMWHKPYLVQQMKEDFDGRVPRWVDTIRRTAG